jgi:hypothetical protein
VIDVKEEDDEDSPDTLAPPTTATATTSTSTPTSTPSESTPPTLLPTSTSTSTKKPKSKHWKGVLKDLPLPHHLPGGHFKGFSLSLPGTPLRYPVGASGASTPETSGTGTRASSVAGSPDEKDKERDDGSGEDYFGAKWMEEQKERERKERKERERKERKERERREKEKRRKRKRAEVYVRLFSLLTVPSSSFNSYPYLTSQITRHVAAILQRQEFILKLARAMMMFGGPSHRLVAQIQSTARVLELEMSCLYLPDVMWISFEDNATGTSHVKFIRQASALDLGKLGEAHGLYWDVCVSFPFES